MMHWTWFGIICLFLLCCTVVALRLMRFISDYNERCRRDR